MFKNKMPEEKDSVLTLSPSMSYSSTLSNTTINLQTTPKLPKRERLASFSRLIASENFIEIMPEKLSARKHIRRPFKKFSLNSETLPDIQISPSSPEVVSWIPQPDISKIKDSRNSGLLQLPFSPNLSSSPNYASPPYRQSTPMKSPLYISEHKGVFLGRGSFGNVTLFTHKGKKFALKVTYDRASCIGERNFIKIRHPHLVSILHVVPVLDKVFICMEFAGHCNLQQILDNKSELDFPRRLSFTIQIALGLRHCHQRQIVHGDVKPANVIVSPQGICKLGDFGHSINLNTIPKGKVLNQEDIIGTAVYAAPEVLRGNYPTLPSDIYSFGILLWQVQSRELPFAGEHPHVIIYKVVHDGLRPKFEIGSLVMYKLIAERCWHEQPSQRSDISDISKKLQEIENFVKKR